VKVEYRIAITYNVISVLESMHASRMFELLHREELDFLADLDLSVYRKFRQLSIEFIFATDMSKHASNVSELKNLMFEELDFSLSGVRVPVLKSVLKMADISNSTREWKTCREWAYCIMDVCNLIALPLIFFSPFY
jgi:hypothetical protein